MSVHTGSAYGNGPDADLVEYVVLTIPDETGLAGVVGTVQQLVESGVISLIDAVLLTRGADTPTVTTVAPAEHVHLAALLALADRRLRLSDHDVALAAATLDPAVAILMLLVEDRWALALADAARSAGGRVSAGERVSRERVLAGLAQRRVGPASVAAAGHVRSTSTRGDLLSRGPQAFQCHGVLAADAAAQVTRMTTLLEQDMLTFEQYEIQRRRAVHE